MGNSSSRKAGTKELTKGTSANGNLDKQLSLQMEEELNFAALAQLKERRRAELLAFEEQQAKRLEEEAMMKNKLQENRDKFLNHITESQKQLEGQIAEIQQQQELWRQKFSQDLSKSEAEMEAGIENVLKDIRAHRDHNQMQELIKAEECQSQAILALKMEEFKNFRKADMLSAMQAQLESDIISHQNSQNKLLFNIVALEDEAKDRQVQKILEHRQNDQTALVFQLLEEESWQREAFKSLLAQRDLRTTQLNEDIRMVIDQLNQLTGWELQRKCRQQDITTSALEANRRQLAEMLAQLLLQQEQRRKDLKQLLEDMEAQRQNQAADYWLMQYQQLMENVPQPVQSAVSSLRSWETKQPDTLGATKDQPSAPSPSYSDDTAAPSAPSATDVYMETTCVICLDSMCQIIFLPCGHLCCCNKCGNSINQCPMCRSFLVQRIQVHS